MFELKRNLIYKVYLIDGDTSISLLEATFKDLKKIQDQVLTNFFNAINKTIDTIHEAMAKGRKVNEMNRILESEDSTVFIHYHPLSRVLFCSISDADDNSDKLKSVMISIGNRFWKKHRSDLDLYRTTTDKSVFQTFIADIENLSMGGRIGEIFPKLLVIKNVLTKILSMGMISDFEYQVALQCNGENSPLKISRIFEKNRSDIYDVLKKLEELDIIKIQK